MENGEDTPSLWERIKRRWQERRTGSPGSAAFSADGGGVVANTVSHADRGAASADLAPQFDRRADRDENAGDLASAETLFQAVHPNRESGLLPRRFDPLDFGGAVFGFSAGDRSDPQPSADPGPFADAGPRETDNT